MDIATIIGIISGIGLVIGSILMNSGLGLFIDMASLMIVAGGTLAATLIAYPLNEVLSVFGHFARVFIFRVKKPMEVIQELTDLSKIAHAKVFCHWIKRLKMSKTPFLPKPYS